MKTTIIYENSFGIISQWAGEVLELTQSTISIKFSAKKALKIDFKANSGFLIVCKKKTKPLGLLNSENYKNGWTCFDENLRTEILHELEKNQNIEYYRNGKNLIKN
jgi:hypothetical protein